VSRPDRGIGRLQLERVSRSYGEVRAVDDVSLDVASGEFITLLGPSGSGKTTTLKIIAGFTRANMGRVVLDGRDITTMPPHRRHIGMVFQNYALFPHMTAAENVAFPLRIRKVSRREISKRVEDALAMVHLPGMGDRFARQLSGGQQQRIALARALVFQPNVLLMDEPLGALDKKLREAMQLEIVRISRQVGVTVIYVTHDQEEALAMSDRIAIYRAGVIEQVGSGEDLYERPASLFVADFVGESTVFRGTLEWRGAAPRLVGPTYSFPVSAEACRRADLHDGDRAAVVVRPEWLGVEGAGDLSVPGDRASVDGGTLVEDIYLGSSRKFVVDLMGSVRATARVRGNDSRPPDVTPGSAVRVCWDIEHGVVVADEIALPSAMADADADVEVLETADVEDPSAVATP
jgi:putative spermidine/putrescine transport system ATP-binding protein